MIGRENDAGSSGLSRDPAEVIARVRETVGIEVVDGRVVPVAFGPR